MKAPYHTYGSSEAHQMIFNGIAPRPEDHPLIPPESGIWSVLQACWLVDPSCRPNMFEVIDLVSPNKPSLYEYGRD